jgi:hypothetical protein
MIGGMKRLFLAALCIAPSREDRQRMRAGLTPH